MLGQVHRRRQRRGRVNRGDQRLLQRQQVALAHVCIDLHAGIGQGIGRALLDKGLSVRIGDVAQVSLGISGQQVGGSGIQHTAIVPARPLVAD